eukprot:12862532-Alexandrium_andersonii.AAC.1
MRRQVLECESNRADDRARQQVSHCKFECKCTYYCRSRLRGRASACVTGRASANVSEPSRLNIG